MLRLFACAMLALTEPAAPGDAPRVRSSANSGMLHLRGSFQVEAPTELVWEVLTDYGRLPDFIQSVRRSIVRERTHDSVVLEQEATAHALFLTKTIHLLLRIEERRPHAIFFQDVRHRDFEVYRGEWRVREAGRRQEVSYELRARPRIGLPDSFANRALQANAVELLEKLRLEIRRRVPSYAPSTAR